MSDTPSVSVIIPTRDCLPWLPGAIRSIGSAPDIEIIVFDDGSSDGTPAWLAEAALADPRIVVMRGNGIGPAKARNRAIAAARAPLLAFLDADDRWLPGKLDIQLAAHRTWPEIALSFTDYRHVTEDPADLGPCFAYWPRFNALATGQDRPFVLGGDALARIYAEPVIGTSTVIARTDLVRAIGGFVEDLPSSEDWDLWLRLISRGQAACVPTVLMDYLMHRPGSETRNLRTRVLALRIIGARHHTAAAAISRTATRVFASRLLAAEAEIAHAEGNDIRSAALSAAAFLRAPSKRALRETLGATRRALRSRFSRS